MYCADIEQRDWKVRSIHHRSNPYQTTWSSTERIATESHDELQDDLCVFNQLKNIVLSWCVVIVSQKDIVLCLAVCILSLF